MEENTEKQFFQNQICIRVIVSWDIQTSLDFKTVAVFDCETCLRMGLDGPVKQNKLFIIKFLVSLTYDARIGVMSFDPQHLFIY